MILTGNETYTINFTGNSHVLQSYHKPNEIITIKRMKTDALSLVIDDNSLIKFRNQEPTFLKFTNEADPTHTVTLNNDGSIQIEGDATKALEQLIIMCWNIFESEFYAKGSKNILIFDYLKIDLEECSIKYLKDNPPKEYFQIKKAIEKRVIRKLKLKAFW